MSKLLVVLGITGNQGGSVAEVFLKDPNYKIRGVTRNPSSAASQALAAKGIEIVQGDINDVSTLKNAFAGATHIFGNTAFESHTAIAPTASDLAKLRPGQTILEWAYELEVQQGKNIADAAAAVLKEEGKLELFIWSTLSAARKWSKGKYEAICNFDSKAVVVEYLRATYPELDKKMSLLQMGIFPTNWKWGQVALPWEKLSDGTFLLRIPGSGNAPIPFVLATDAGPFAYALSKVAPGKHLLAFGDRITWYEYTALWSKVTGVPTRYEDSEVADLDRLLPGGYGKVAGELFAYAKEFGYDGGDPEVIHPKDLGVEIPPVTRIEDYFKNEDWTPLLTRYG